MGLAVPGLFARSAAAGGGDDADTSDAAVQLNSLHLAATTPPLHRSALQSRQSRPGVRADTAAVATASFSVLAASLWAGLDVAGALPAGYRHFEVRACMHAC